MAEEHVKRLEQVRLLIGGEYVTSPGSAKPYLEYMFRGQVCSIYWVKTLGQYQWNYPHKSRDNQGEHYLFEPSSFLDGLRKKVREKNYA